MDPLAAIYRKRIYRTRAWRGTALLAACAIFLVFLGPVFDHHFAERQFGHSHLSLGGNPGGHVHFYEAEGGHSHLHPPPSESPGNGSVPATEVVNLTLADGVGTVFGGLGGPIANDAPVVHHPASSVLLFRLFDERAILFGAFVAPPDRPPRV